MLEWILGSILLGLTGPGAEVTIGTGTEIRNGNPVMLFTPLPHKLDETPL